MQEFGYWPWRKGAQPVAQPLQRRTPPRRTKRPQSPAEPPPAPQPQWSEEWSRDVPFYTNEQGAITWDEPSDAARRDASPSRRGRTLDGHAYVCCVQIPRTSRGAAAAAAWIVRGVAATPWIGHGSSVETDRPRHG